VASRRGDELYALVGAYAALGDHRTATAIDEATRAWFSAELERRGATVAALPYEVDRYVARASVTVEGGEIEALPLFYSGVGSVDTVDPSVARVDTAFSFPSEVERALEAATGRHADAVVIATNGPGGRLVALNRDPAPPRGPLALLIAGRDHARLEAGRVRVVASARCEGAVSATVTGRFGAPTPHPLVVTTSLTGWFACAGERGTGIAVLLEVASAMAVDAPVLVVATTGHELGFAGLHDYLARSALEPRAVLHVGAGLAAGDGRELGPLRFALVDGLDAPTTAGLADALTDAALPVRRVDGDWPSEGQRWRALGAPVLSMFGAFERVHTADDIAAEVTSPELLDRVARSVLDATRALVEGPR
jgi:hypothetical protein